MTARDLQDVSLFANVPEERIRRAIDVICSQSAMGEKREIECRQLRLAVWNNPRANELALHAARELLKRRLIIGARPEDVELGLQQVIINHKAASARQENEFGKTVLPLFLDAITEPDSGSSRTLILAGKAIEALRLHLAAG